MARLEVTGLEELSQRMKQWPNRFRAALEVTMNAALLTVWEKIPSYPPKPQDSTYIRTGTLGKSLGGSFSGGKTGTTPDIYEIKSGSTNMIEASFGTRLDYAQVVIGEQQRPYNRHWWTMHKTVLRRIQQPINRIFNAMADEMTKWLDGKKQF